MFEALIKTEQAEPLLLLADHIAGYHYSCKAYGIADGNKKGGLLAVIKPLYDQIPGGCYHVREEQFREEYPLPPATFDHALPKKEREALLEALFGKKETNPKTD